MQPSHPDYPKPSSKATINVMKANKRANTKPEVAIRSDLHRKGFRFRKDFNIKIDGKNYRPDIVFTKQRIAIFIDGCFWHMCPLHGHIPKSNEHYWKPKLIRNVERDGQNDKKLRKAGWIVIRFWEHTPSDEVLRTLSKKIRI